MKPSERAIIYLREMRPDCPCYDKAAREGYRVIGLVLDPDGSKFQALQESVMNGAAEVILTCSRSDIPADRIPRIESNTQDLPPLPGEETLRMPRSRRFRRPNTRRADVIIALGALDAMLAAWR